MIIKKYVADTMNEALNLIKLELGPNAIIVSKRSVKQKGVMGIFLPKKLEVTAAIDEVPIAKNQKEQDGEAKEYTSKKEIEQELTEVKEMLQKIVDEKKVKKDKRRIGIKRLLLERDVNEDVVNSLIDSAKKRDKYKNVSRLPDSALEGEIDQIIKTGHETDGRIHIFIGPTGVGKTTTIAKLAAIKSLNESKKIGLITIDTYRIGAVEQLKIYADILGMPFQVINSVNDINKALQNLKDCDNIFVDTTGRSIKNLMHLSELKLYLDKIKPDTIHLVMSMTTKYSDMLNIINGFSTMNYNSIILTKFDETATYGPIVNVAYNTKAPISYLAVGQNVPDDLEKATKDRLVDLVMGGGTI